VAIVDDRGTHDTVDTRPVVACNMCEWAVRRAGYWAQVNAYLQHEEENPGHKTQIISAAEANGHG